MEHVILFAGPMGAGKTTGVSTLSDIPIVRTEAINSDTERNAKATTTVGLDYGQITLNEGEVVRLYGVPGQERFEFMWRILETRARGLVLLLDHGARDPLGDLDLFLDKFRLLSKRGAAVIGVTHSDQPSALTIEHYYEHLSRKGLSLPLYEVDARNHHEMVVLLTTLVVLIESRATEEAA
jgi:signal recognition particle receptor subunit beta